MPTVQSLAGRTVLISGATSGIGAETARACLAGGARVVLCGRSLDKVEKLVDESSGMAVPVFLDVDEPQSVASLPARLPEGFGQIDTLVCNAGHDIGGRRMFHEGEAEQWAAIIETNVSGVIRLCRAFIDSLLQRDDGHIVTIGSTSGLRTYPGGSAYGASKFAVRALTDGLRQDYRTRPLRITEILPGVTRTGFAEARLGGDKQAGEAYYDGFQACLDPGDVADAVLFALTAPPHVNISQLVIVPTLEK